MRAEYRLLLSLLLLLPVLHGLGQEEDYTKSRSIIESYAVEQDCYVEIINKYGDIEVKTWEKDSVRIDVTIKTISEKYEWREEMMESLDVDFTTTSGFVIAETVWKEGAGFWRKSTYNVSKELSANRIEVNYIVHLPTRMPLEIRNRFGNVFMRDYEGELDVEVRHGDFRARDLGNVRNLDVRYGRVKVNQIDKGQVEIGSGSSLDLGEAKELLLTSASSKVEIGRVTVLNMESNHDEVFIDEVGSLNGSFSLSDLLIRTLERDMQVTTQYGSTRIQQIAQEATHVVVEASRTDVVVGLSIGFAGRFNIEVDGDEQFVHPQEMYTTTIDLEDGKRKAITGSIGEREGTKVSITSSKGSVSIGE